MENYEKVYINILREGCDETENQTNDLSWYYWRIHRLEAIVEFLIKENNELKAVSGL